MLLLISGSLRQASSNTKLLGAAGALYGGDTVEANLRLPLYDGDLENQGLPNEVQTLSDQIAAAEAVVIATPEYNQSLTGVLKNALDWVSRTKGGPWRDKPLAIMSAAAGRSGGARATYALRLAMAPFRPRFSSGPELLLADSNNQFDDTGALTNERAMATLTEAMEQLRKEAILR
ncbi:MAG: NADPH-dependent FMN reductase [Pseudomonadota bacterium]